MFAKSVKGHSCFKYLKWLLQQKVCIINRFFPKGFIYEDFWTIARLLIDEKTLILKFLDVIIDWIR